MPWIGLTHELGVYRVVAEAIEMLGEVGQSVVDLATHSGVHEGWPPTRSHSGRTILRRLET